MGIVSYAQNFEDVLLWRAVGHIEAGFYLDIGAQHPVVDSVSRAFYENGWRGIHVEPTTHHVNLLRSDRPEETVLQAVISDRSGLIRFYEIPDGGLSTAKRDIAEGHMKALGCQVEEKLVPAITLDELLALAPGENIQWMKIDVEGFESEVFSGWRESAKRPWVIIVESTLPMTQTDTFELWEPQIKDKGYQMVYADGLNRYYVSAEHLDLQKAFKFPPNIFDGFQLSGRSTSMTTRLTLAAASQVDELTKQKDLAERALAEYKLQNGEISSDRQELLAPGVSAPLIATTRSEFRESLEQSRKEAWIQWALLKERESVFSEQIREFAQKDARNEARQVAAEETWKRRLEERETQLKHDFDALSRAARDSHLNAEQALATLQDDFRRIVEVLDHGRREVADRAADRIRALEQREAELMRALERASADARDEQELARGNREAAEADFARVLDSLETAERTAQELSEQNRQIEAEKERIKSQLETLAEDNKSISDLLGARTRERDSLSFQIEAIRSSPCWPAVRWVNACLGQKWPPPQADFFPPVPINIPSVNQHGAGGRVIKTTNSGDIAEVDLGVLLSLHGERFIRESYKVLLKRDADPAGLSQYLYRLALGDSRSMILQSLAHSEESRCEDILHLSDDAFVTTLYQRILGRSPDPQGKAGYLEGLAKGRRRTKIIRDIRSSSEALGRDLFTSNFEKQVRALVSEEDRLSGWRGWVFGRRRLERRLGQLDWVLGSLKTQLSVAVDELAGRLRTNISPTSGNREPARVWQDNAFAAHASASVPSDIQTDHIENLIEVEHEELDGVHPRSAEITSRMILEGPYAELGDELAGRTELDHYIGGCYPAEDSGEGPVRWSTQKAVAYLYVLAPVLHIKAAGFFGDRAVRLTVNDRGIGEFNFKAFPSAISISVESWQHERIRLGIESLGITNPKSLGISSDNRDLGLLIHSIHFGEA